MAGNPGSLDPTTISLRVASLTGPRDATQLLCDLEALKRQVDAAMAQVVATVERNLWFHDDGHLSASTWVRGIVNVTGSEAKRIGKLADLARGYPRVIERLADGSIHDGYWYVSDTGGAIKGEKIDLYTGSGRGSMAQARRLNMRTLTIADAGRFDGCPPAWESAGR